MRPHASNARPIAIDREKLRAALRRIGDDSVYCMLAEAVELLSPAALARLVKRYIPLDQLQPDASRGKRTLVDEVRSFDRASRAGEYYESFNVTSKNCTTTSGGTRAFIAEMSRLLDRCVSDAGRTDPATAVVAFEILFELHRYIDECNDDVVFFADEGSAWQIGVDWQRVLPAWFACLSKTADPPDYRRRIDAVIDELDLRSRAKHLAAAGKLGTAAHRRNVAALTGVAGRRA